ncbi:hypothetical protein [Roseovarius salinarum]|uniref:hypothetical protein n=1 Tax=Roseovarius salinarum TaxID=1981892 RepID=UPI0012FFFC90|nr:hypothetical protein [Roseovarius salinarum]
MTDTTTIPKDERPRVIEQRLREFRRDNPGKWMPWKDLLSEIGGSEREFSRMMRAAKEKILAEEAVVANAPDLPDEMKKRNSNASRTGCGSGPATWPT